MLEAARGHTLVSNATFEALEATDDLELGPMALQLKGKREAALAYDVKVKVARGEVEAPATG